MIQKLRIKFICITMSLICIVLLAVFGAIAISNYQQSVRESLQIMERQLSLDDPASEVKPRIGAASGFLSKNDIPPEEKQPMRMLPLVTVTVDAEMNIISDIQENATISDDDLSDAISQAMKSRKNTGILSKLNLRYMKKAIGSDTCKIVFVDRTSELTTIRTLLLSLVFIFIITMAVFFIICILLSRWALKPAEEAWTKQRQFIADASHELKTPLTVILANLGIISAHPEKTVSSQSKWLENTRTEAQRMKKLVEDLLFLAKSDALEMPVAMADFDISEALWSVLLPFETYAFEQGLEISENIENNILFCGDISQIKQLISILLDNSCKYAQKGSTVTVDLHKTADKIMFSVHNIGGYIPPEDISHIFDRFYRADKSRSRTNGSYGLGLAIAKTITDLHRGQIHVTSNEKTGTTFTAVLPRTS